MEPPLQLDNCQRSGIMAAFTKFEDFENSFDLLMDMFVSETPPDSPTVTTTSEVEDANKGISISMGSDHGITITDYETKVCNLTVKPLQPSC